MKNSLSTLTLSLIAIIILSSVAMADQSWQLVFRYDNDVLNLIQADPIPPMTKQARTPGLGSAPVRVSYALSWRDGGGSSLLETEFQMPLGLRSTLAADGPCQAVMPTEGVVVVRVNGPDPLSQPASLQLTNRTVTGRSVSVLPLPDAFNQTDWQIPMPPSSATQSPDEGPVGVVKIRDTGDDGNRLVIVIMGDGYTNANLTAGQFESAAAGLEADFALKQPWDIMLGGTNIYRVDIESNEQGADHEVFGVYKDTYLNASYWVSNIERLLALTGDGYSQAVSAANSMVGVGAWDMILVLVNSTKYGGSGGSIAVSSVNSSASEIVLHELGHSYGNLADEYTTPYPGYPPGDSEPNVDYDFSGPGLKWLAWVEPGTPLPTPAGSTYGSDVGAFEGARYYSIGIYRPWNNCLMRSLNRPLDPVCKEAHLLELMNITSLADDLWPTPLTSQDITNGGTLFQIAPLPIPGLTFQWSLDGVPLAGGNGVDYNLSAGEMTATNQTLTLRVDFATEHIRLDTVFETYSWPVVDAGGCCFGAKGNIDCSVDGIVDVNDLTDLIDFLFVSFDALCCEEEANIDGSLDGISDVEDLTALIDHLFIAFPPLPPCP